MFSTFRCTHALQYTPSSCEIFQTLRSFVGLSSIYDRRLDFKAGFWDAGNPLPLPGPLSTVEKKAG
jgi:hypothetical protein